MNERLRICLWMLGGGGLGSVLGAIFGAIAAAMYARNGGAAGTNLARNTVENFLKMGDRQPSPTLHAALIGAADGFFFLGILGLILGMFLGKSGLAADELLLPIAVCILLLIGGAIFFGSMAYALTFNGAQFLYICASTFLLGILGATLFDSAYGATGLGAGGIIGLALCRVSRAYSPKFQPPRMGETVPQPRSDADANITDTPPGNDDRIANPDSIKEL